MLKIITLMLTATLCQSLFAATIAVMDSGTDIKHKDIAPYVWINPNEIPDNNRDEDRNGYQDDVYGWNFAEGNGQVIDYKYLGTFSEDVYTFFEYQYLAMLGAATEEQMNWLRTKVGEEDFIKELTIFGNFVHGTHVSGIAISGLENSKLLSVKLIPTEVSLPKKDKRNKSKPKKDGVRMKLVKKGLAELAKAQMTSMIEIAAYIKNHKVDVANGSFGTGFAQAAMIAKIAFKAIFWRDATEEETNKLAVYFLNAMITEGKKMMDEAPNTLFVFAAGNDGTDNDVLPISPANIIADNKISVAATYKRLVLAPFSNYGIDNVDVAAPGMGINSSIPGDEYLVVSGTSQASPYVARVAGGVKEINPNLTPKEIKQVLIETVDFKDYLTDKVKSGGIVNDQRAFEAARLSINNSLTEAIKMSRENVRDYPVQKGEGFVNFNYGYVLPLPSMFKF